MTEQDAATTSARHRQTRFFDDESPHLDRFGALPTLTIASVAALSLVDLEAISDDFWRGIASFALSLITGLTLALASHAAGVTLRDHVRGRRSDCPGHS